MAFNTKITLTWASAADQLNSAVDAARTVLLAQMESEGKTDGVLERVSDVVSIRHFIDVAAANEYGSGIVSICNENAVTPPTYVID